MKNILKKNQVIIAALAIMIIVAGYLNYTKGKLDDQALNPDSKNVGDLVTDTSGTLKDDDLEISEGNTDSTGNLVDNENANSGSEVGEAVLANNGISSDYFVSNKLKREQTRAQSETTLKEIINNTNISDKQKQAAIDKMIELTTIKEKETVTEALLEAKGFSETLVTITDGSVEVVVNAQNLTEQQMAQIEDVVKRKTGISAKNIVISPINVVDENTKSSDSTANADSDDTDSNATSGQQTSDEEAGSK